MQQPAVSIPWPGGTYLFLYVLFIALQLGEFVFVQVVPVIHGHVVLIVVLRRLVQAKEQKQLLRSTNINCVPTALIFSECAHKYLWASVNRGAGRTYDK